MASRWQSMIESTHRTRAFAALAQFTLEDLDEARSRLTRLAQIWSIRLRSVDQERLDRIEGDAWTLRQIAFHLGSTFYADSVGDLTARSPATR